MVVNMIRKRIASLLSWSVVVLLFSFALWVLFQELHNYKWHDIRRSLALFPKYKIILGLSITFISYLTLTLYDWLAVSFAKVKLLYKKVALTSAVSSIFSNNIGLSAFSGSAVRYRFYSVFGLSAFEIAKIITFCMVTFWLGMALSGAIAFLTQPVPIPDILGVKIHSMTFVGWIFLAIVLFYIGGSFFLKRPIKIKNIEIELPHGKLLIKQLIVACTDWIIAALVLYVLLPDGMGLSFFRFFSIFMLSQTLSVVSNIPGGLGVFESLMLICMQSYASVPDMMGVLLFYRLIYYLIPFLIGIATFVLHEISLQKEHTDRIFGLFGKWFPRFFPVVLAILIFIAGLVLIFSGATPSVNHRMLWLDYLFPIHVIEISHFLGSLTGGGLLILSLGIYKRVDGAYFLSLASLAAGAVFSLLKGLDYEEMIVMVAMFLALLPCKSYFYRKSKISGEFFSIQWFILVSIVVISSIWIGLFYYKHIEYTNELWWKFEFLNDASRFLRASLGLVVFLLFFALYNLLKIARYRPFNGAVVDIEGVREIIKQTNHTYVNLALLGDKLIMMNEAKNAFIMYNVSGQSWIAMGDPVGDEPSVIELAWKFREEAYINGAYPVFYEIDQKNFHLYIDLGLVFTKIGEEAIVRLDTFSLEGKFFQSLRNVLNRFDREGFSFEVIEPENQHTIVAELKEISDIWLKSKKTSEKKFSLGFFNEKYLSNFRIAVVKKEGKIYGFSNIWEATDHSELTVDLMRYNNDAPNGIMDYLFVRMMLWGKAQGYGAFNLGMAPLSGLHNRALSPLWNKVASLLFTYGENFYNFQGLRHYKDKFKPEWRPKYIASPGGFIIPGVLTDLTLLIGGGLKGVVAK